MLSGHEAGYSHGHSTVLAQQPFRSEEQGSIILPSTDIQTVSPLPCLHMYRSLPLRLSFKKT